MKRFLATLSSALIFLLILVYVTLKVQSEGWGNYSVKYAANHKGRKIETLIVSVRKYGYDEYDNLEFGTCSCHYQSG